jgi:hypothetical protein
MKDIDPFEDAYKKMQELRKIANEACTEYEHAMTNYFALLESYRLGLREGRQPETRKEQS